MRVGSQAGDGGGAVINLQRKRQSRFRGRRRHEDAGRAFEREGAGELPRLRALPHRAAHSALVIQRQAEGPGIAMRGRVRVVEKSVENPLHRDERAGYEVHDKHEVGLHDKGQHGRGRGDAARPVAEEITHDGLGRDGVRSPDFQQGRRTRQHDAKSVGAEEQWAGLEFHDEPGEIADGRAADIGDEHGVIRHVGRVNVRQVERHVRCALDAHAVLAPLVKERRRPRGHDGEGHIRARVHRLRPGLLGDERRRRDVAIKLRHPASLGAADAHPRRAHQNFFLRRVGEGQRRDRGRIGAEETGRVQRAKRRVNHPVGRQSQDAGTMAEQNFPIRLQG